MEYICIGFLLAVGWTIGDALCGALIRALVNKAVESDWYREAKAKEMRNSSDDIKTIKGPIGFRYKEES